jgi:hypothetical protein
VADVLRGSWRAEPPTLEPSPNLDAMALLLLRSGPARVVAREQWRAHPRRKLCIRRTGRRPSAALRERQVAAAFRVLRKTSIEAVLGKGWATGSFLKNHLNMGGRLGILPEAKSHMQPLC